jgi:hypothetical protein
MKETKVYIVAAFLLGGVLGFVGGVCSTKAGKAFIERVFEPRQAADIEQKQEIVRSEFRLSFPGNWKVNTASENYDPDHVFTIHAPGSGHVTIIVFHPPIAATTAVNAQVRAMQKLLSHSTQTAFSRWGAYEGKGVSLKGNSLGIQPVEVRIFSHAGPERTFVAVEYIPDRDLSDVQPGFNLVESTFKINE